MQVVIVLLAPLLMLTACQGERRGGPALAGAVGAAPVVVLVGIVSVAADLGTAAARDLALSTATHVVAQVVLALTFAWMARARGIRLGLVVSLGSFVAASVLIAVVPRLWAVAASGLALVVGARLTRDGAASARSSARPHAAAAPLPKVVALRALVALVAASGIWLASHQFGPGVGGAVGSFPAFSVSLACLVAADTGTAGLVDVLHGLIRALPAYLAFCLAYWIAAATAGVLVSLAAAVGTCLATYAILLNLNHRIVPTAAVPSDDCRGWTVAAGRRVATHRSARRAEGVTRRREPPAAGRSR